MVEAKELAQVLGHIGEAQKTLSSWQYRLNTPDDLKAISDKLERLKETIRQCVERSSSLPPQPQQAQGQQQYQGNRPGQPLQPLLHTQPLQLTQHPLPTQSLRRAQGQQQHQGNRPGQPLQPTQHSLPFRPQRAQGYPNHTYGQPQVAIQPNQGTRIEQVPQPTGPPQAQGQQALRNNPGPVYILPPQTQQAAETRPFKSRNLEAPLQVAQASRRDQTLQPKSAHYQQPQVFGIPGSSCPVYINGPVTVNFNIIQQYQSLDVTTHKSPLSGSSP